MSGGPWLGPTVESAILALKGQGHKGVVIAPIGFVCDHVEVLYDIDIGFRQFATEQGLKLWRTESLNTSPTFIAGLAHLAKKELDLALNTGHGMKRVAIIGGGIAGLSAAFYLEKARRGGAAVEWLLLEKSDRLGGVIRTERQDGFVLEAGPDSFLTAKPEGARFCSDLGIGDQLIASNDAGRKTYIVVKGQLVPIPDGLEFMVPTRVLPMATTPLFSLGSKLRMAAEFFSSRGNHQQDESVADFIRRHFGQEMVDRVAEPLLAGVYGGDADRMSVRAVLPRFAEMERESGSLVRATLKARKARAVNSVAPQPLFTSLKNGMQEMVDAAVAALPPDRVRLRQGVSAVRPSNDDWEVSSGTFRERFQAVLLAVPASSAAGLLRQFHPAFIGGLSQIQYSSSAAVAAGLR